MKINETSAAPAIKKGVEVSDVIILRQAIIAEMDASNLYEQMAKSAKNAKVKEILLDISKEEKVHVGELTALLEALDKEHVPAIADGKKEVGKISSLKEWINKREK